MEKLKDDQQVPERLSSDGYRWTCPICGMSRTNRATDGGDESNAVVGLRAHIVATEGGGHGPANAYPPDFDAERLPEHVTEVG